MALSVAGPALSVCPSIVFPGESGALSLRRGQQDLLWGVGIDEGEFGAGWLCTMQSKVGSPE